MFLQLAHTNYGIFRETKTLVLEIYRITKLFPTEEKFNLVQQLRRAALSSHLNVGEGFARKSTQERKRFFEIARSSVVEVDTAIDISCELKYCNKTELNNLGITIVSCFKQLTGLMK